MVITDNPSPWKTEAEDHKTNQYCITRPCVKKEKGKKRKH
jgi:hypothetical protein